MAGISPEKWLNERFKFPAREVRLESVMGREPLREFEDKSKWRRNLKERRFVGREPESYERERLVRAPVGSEFTAAFRARRESRRRLGRCLEG